MKKFLVLFIIILFLMSVGTILFSDNKNEHNWKAFQIWIEKARESNVLFNEEIKKCITEKNDNRYIDLRCIDGKAINGHISDMIHNLETAQNVMKEFE